jgi:hypothetical protein
MNARKNIDFRDIVHQRDVRAYCSSIAGPEDPRLVAHAGLKPRR